MEVLISTIIGIIWEFPQSSKFLLDIVVLQVLPNFGQFFENTVYRRILGLKKFKFQIFVPTRSIRGFVVRNFSLRSSKKLKSVWCLYRCTFNFFSFFIQEPWTVGVRTFHADANSVATAQYDFLEHIFRNEVLKIADITCTEPRFKWCWSLFTCRGDIVIMTQILPPVRISYTGCGMQSTFVWESSPYLRTPHWVCRQVGGHARDHPIRHNIKYRIVSKILQHMAAGSIWVSFYGNTAVVCSKPFMLRLHAMTKNCKNHYFSKSTNIRYHQDSQQSRENIFTIDKWTNSIA